MTLPKEIKFEDHFCDKLSKNGYRIRENKHIDIDFNIDDELLLEFLSKTHPFPKKSTKLRPLKTTKKPQN